MIDLPSVPEPVPDGPRQVTLINAEGRKVAHLVASSLRGVLDNVPQGWTWVDGLEPLDHVRPSDEQKAADDARDRIALLEASQDRAVREALLGDASALDRLRAIDDAVKDKRDILTARYDDQ